MAKTKVRKLKEMGPSKAEPVVSDQLIPVNRVAEEAPPTSGSEPVASEKPVPTEGAANEVFMPSGPEPTACEGPTPSDVSLKEGPSPTESPAFAPLDISTAKAEFSLRIGSAQKARKSIIKGYLTMVLMPTVIVLAFICLLKTQNTAGARSLVASMEFMLGSIAVLGIPIMAVSWFHGLYPKGSCGRFASGSIFALLLGLWLVLVLVASNLQSAVADFGATLKLDWLSLVICLTSVFFFGRAVSEFVDDRRAWRKRMGAEVKRIRLDLGSPFLDFNRHLGKFSRGNSTAWMAYIKFLIVPLIMLVTADYILNRLDLEAKSAIVASVSSMFGTVLLFGTAMVLIRFARGFYPCGSLSRAVYGLASVPVLSLFAWEVLVGSGIEYELEQNYFILDMSLVMLPVLMYVMFVAVFEISELKDGRRAYRRWVGLPVNPYVPGDMYNRLNDFDPFYASFASGTKIGRYVLYTYAVEVLAIILLVAIGVSVYQSPDSGGLSEDVRSYLNPPVLDNSMDHMIFVLLILAVANTAWQLLAFSYRAGSFSRLALSGVVALVASDYAYNFWSALAAIFQSRDLTLAINSIMFATFGLIMARAIWELYKGYLRSRNKYLDWRLAMLRRESPVITPPSPPIFPASASIPSGALTDEVLAFPIDLKGPTLDIDRVPSQQRIPSAASFSFDISSEDQSSSDDQDEQ